MREFSTEDEAGVEASSGDLPLFLADLSGTTALVIDDEADILELLTDMLQMCHCEVFQASNGAAALEYLAKA
mgnify:CR=1 FL=1